MKKKTKFYLWVAVTLNQKQQRRSDATHLVKSGGSLGNEKGTTALLLALDTVRQGESELVVQKLSDVLTTNISRLDFSNADDLDRGETSTVTSSHILVYLIITAISISFSLFSLILYKNYLNKSSWYNTYSIDRQLQHGTCHGIPCTCCGCRSGSHNGSRYRSSWFVQDAFRGSTILQKKTIY